MSTSTVEWTLKPFERLTPEELYRLLQLRSRVFVVEQQCIYLDEDDKDQQAFHLLGMQDGSLAACSRLFKPGDYFEEAAIGRIVSAPEVRGRGVGRMLMRESIAIARRMYGPVSIRIAAQYYLKTFYESFGFRQVSDIFPEDGIDHIEMLLT